MRFSSPMRAQPPHAPLLRWMRFALRTLVATVTWLWSYKTRAGLVQKGSNIQIHACAVLTETWNDNVQKITNSVAKKLIKRMAVNEWMNDTRNKISASGCFVMAVILKSEVTDCSESKAKWLEGAVATTKTNHTLSLTHGRRCSALEKQWTENLLFKVQKINRLN